METKFHASMTETYFQVGSTVLTNIPYLISSLFIWKGFGMQLGVEILLNIVTFFVSTMYHVTECLRYSPYRRSHFLGMTDGQWHRLENICAIASIQALWLYFMNLKDRETLSCLRWAVFLFALWCQERGPWEIIYTIIPILVPVIICILRFLIFAPLPKVNRNFLFGLFFSAIAIVFFILALDDDRDWITFADVKINRWNHGLWHLFIGAASGFFVFGIEPQKLKPE